MVLSGNPSTSSSDMRLTSIFHLLAIGLVLASCDSSSKDGQIFWENGSLKAEGRMIDGKEQGLWKEYYESGEKRAEVNYENGVREGPSIVFWPSGGIKREGEYLADQYNGQWTSWYENGQKEEEGWFQHGKETGQWRLWDSLGHLTEEHDYINGQLEGWATLFDSGGVREQRYYVNGEMRGDIKKTQDGVITMSGTCMGPEKLPPFQKEYIKLLTPDSILKAHVEYPLEVHVPGVPYMSTALAATKATLKMGQGTQFVLTPDGKGETCIYLMISLANGQKEQYGPACYSVASE